MFINFKKSRNRLKSIMLPAGRPLSRPVVVFRARPAGIVPEESDQVTGLSGSTTPVKRFAIWLLMNCILLTEPRARILVV